jgi:hypothetical protein
MIVVENSNTNSGLNLIKPEKHEDWNQVNCPNCKQSFELDDSDVCYGSYVMDFFTLIGVAYCAGKLLGFIIILVQ